MFSLPKGQTTRTSRDNKLSNLRHNNNLPKIVQGNGQNDANNGQNRQTLQNGIATLFLGGCLHLELPF
jgi:hypothetical protein